MRLSILNIFLFVFFLSVSAVGSNPIILGNKRLTLITPTLFRLEYSINGDFVDEPTMFAYDRSCLLNNFNIDIIEDGSKYIVTTSSLRIEMLNDNSPFGQSNFKVFYKNDGREVSFTGLPNINKNNLGGAISTLDGVTSHVALNDGLLTTDGYYIIVDSGTDLLNNGWFKRRSDNHIQDWYCFVYGKDYKTAFKDLGVISGHVPLTRKYIHGVWYSRFWEYTSNDIKQLVTEFNENDYPLDIMVIDMDWHTKNAKVGSGHGRGKTPGWTGYTWNKKLIPDPEELIAYLHKENIKVSLNDHPHDGIRPHEIMYKDFMKSMDKESYILFDAGNKKYMDNFFKYAHGYSDSIGIDFWWLDWQQDYLYPKVRGSEMSHLQWLNKLYYDKSLSQGLRGVSYSRWAGWGDHRYPVNFSGDAAANWDVLAFEVHLTASSGNSGCYYWIHDIGGFFSENNSELLTRWCQFGAVSAALRTHSAKGKKVKDKRPWLWDDWAENSMKKSYHLRSVLMPYIYTSVWQTHKTMVPFTRCMYIDYPDLKQAYEQPQQYMLGDLLLTAPITSEGKGISKIASQKVWFPDNELWYDYFTGEKHEGGVTDTIYKDINSFPLFVKGGYVLPLQKYTPRPGTEIPSDIVLRVYNGKINDDNSYIMYEDDGISLDYQIGKFSTTCLRYQKSEDCDLITVYPVDGKYDGMPEYRNYTIEYCNQEGINKVLVNNKKTKFEYDRERNLYVIKIGSIKIREKVSVKIY